MTLVYFWVIEAKDGSFRYMRGIWRSSAEATEWARQHQAMPENRPYPAVYTLECMHVMCNMLAKSE